MTPTQGEKAVERLFSEPLAAHGFSLSDDVFIRQVSDDVSHRLAFPGRAAADGTYCFTLWVGVRFVSLESLLRPDMDSPTVVMPVHLLRTDQAFTEWSLTANNDDVVTEVLSDISRYGFPFLTANSTLRSVAERLRSDRDWYTLGPTSRLRTLIAIEFVDGDRAAAVQRLDAVIAERQQGLPKYRLPFVALRRRFDEIHTA